MYDILLVEDDRKIREVISDYFANEPQNWKLTLAADGDEGMEKLYENSYDMVLLDIMMPGIDGFSLCREIRKTSDTPVIFLTARGREEDILYGYDLGCDDYIVKPFSLATLQAKIKAVLNRAKGTVMHEMLSCGDISLNPRTMTVTVSGEYTELPPKQYLILKMLLEQKGAVVSRDEIIVRVWGYDFEGDERVLDNHMKKLRNALGGSGKQIKTVIGRGYRIQD